MIKIKKKNNTKILFKQIENTRKKNNSNWMDLLRIAYDSNPKETVKILKRILKKDEALIKIAKKLTSK